MARIRGARGDAFRTGLPRLFKTLARSGSRKPPVNPGPLIRTYLARPPRSARIISNLPLTPGTRLGVYEVTALIGEGGMGQVYRARDTKLNRDVALKVLPDSFASDPDRLARFTREAQTLASLNHPNIAHIHGLEESGGVRALVMELVEGDDLSQRIARGAIPLDEALPIAKQIAEALEAAQTAGRPFGLRTGSWHRRWGCPVLFAGWRMDWIPR